MYESWTKPRAPDKATSPVSRPAVQSNQLSILTVRYGPVRVSHPLSQLSALLTNSREPAQPPPLTAPAALRLPRCLHLPPPLAALPADVRLPKQRTDIVFPSPWLFPLRPCHSRRVITHRHRLQPPTSSLLHSQSHPLYFDVGSARYTTPPPRAFLPLHHHCHGAVVHLQLA